MSCRSTMANFAKQNEIKYNIKNIVEPWVGNEIAKNFSNSEIEYAQAMKLQRSLMKLS